MGGRELGRREREEDGLLFNGFFRVSASISSQHQSMTDFERVVKRRLCLRAFVSKVRW
jgi:hypothetical protein